MVFDIIVLCIVFCSAIVAFIRGFVREVLTILGLLGAALSALFFGPKMVPVTTGWLVDPAAEAPQKLFNIVPYHMLATVSAYVLVFVVVLVALSVLSHYAAKMVHSMGLGPVDRSLGVAFGLARGVFLIGIIYLPLHIILSDEQRNEWFGSAKTLPYVTYTAEFMQALLPGKHVLGEKDAPAVMPSAGTPNPAAAPAQGGPTMRDPLKGLTGEKS